MSNVRVLVGTKKGAFILTSDEKRAKWKVDGPLFGGWEIYHMKASPVNPDRIFASQTSSWFGQIIQRSDDGGKNWSTPGGENAAVARGGDGRRGAALQSEPKLRDVASPARVPTHHYDRLVRDAARRCDNVRF